MNTKIKRALISLSDKSGIVPFASELDKMGVEILSTGGTAKLLRENGITVKDVSDHTGFPEIMDGRVKTLHPKIHGGLLGLRDNPSHADDAQKNDIGWIDMVVVNLYPFEKTIAKDGVSIEEVIENIDIGGPSMLRSAAKNYRFVAVLTDPSDYDVVLKEIKDAGDVSLGTRQTLCVKVYSRTADYDSAIDSYLREQFGEEKNLRLKYTGGKKLRYGENSHQYALAYADPASHEASLVKAKILHGKDMSYNNYVDGDAALDSVKEIVGGPGVSIIKHTNPCGYATGPTLKDALVRAWEGDPVSAFGSVIAMSQKVDLDTAQFLKGKFVEAVIAPGFEEAALNFLKNKSKDIRLIDIGELGKNGIESVTYKKVVGGMLEQSRDLFVWEKFDVVTKAGFSDEKKETAAFAYKACKHTKSNAIVLVREYQKGQYQVMGMGAGQPNRIDSLRKLSVTRAAENLKIECDAIGSGGDFEEYRKKQIGEMVLASDAFFPFDDTVRASGKYGIKYIIQPGGSKKDQDSIDACNELGIAMALTGMRHFRH